MAPLATPVDAAIADRADIAASSSQVAHNEGSLEKAIASESEQEQATFMARVLAAMNGITKHNNHSGGSGSGGSATSLNSSHKPPRPPSSSARKQLRLLPKQREQSPVQTLTNGHTASSSTTTTRTQNTQNNSYTTRSTTNSSSRSSQSLSTSGLGNGQLEDNESHYEVKLQLPLSTGASPTPSASDAAMDRLRLLTRSPSPAYSISSRCSTQSSVSLSRSSRLETPPRRVFPQSYTRGSGLDAYEMRQLESSPVVFDANLSFVLGCKRQPVHQTLRPSPSFEDPRTSSAYLSEKIQNFLKRTDHVQEEWTAMGRRSRRHNSNSSTASMPVVGGHNSRCSTPGSASTYGGGYDDYDTISLIERQRERNSMERCGSVGRTRSTQNILTKAFQLSKQMPHTPTSRGNSMARESSVATTTSAMQADDDDDRTIREEDDNELDELSELTVDLAEERSTAHIATERLEAETGERLKLEKELGEQQSKVKNLQEMTEKLEMELICAKSDLNGISEDEDGEHEEGAGGVYKLKYERVARELEFTKRRLRTQHEHDLEQLVGLKKQLEKKLSDAYEEVEEQRQVVGQWKRKVQKMTNEMNDLRMLLEEQNARNNLLEKKQRKFDAECQSLQDASRQERQAKERYGREKDVLQAEKFTLEQTLADTRLDLELKEEKLASLQRELEEMTFGGGTEEEFAQLRRSKNETERRAKEQEEELDEMAGQIQLLEQAKLRLEMTLETMRKEARRESQQRDEELEEVRGNGYKKIKALECQLETEHEERTLLLREKHELERRLSSMEDRDRVDRDAEEAQNQKLRRDLRKYKALLKDAQTQLERLKADTPGKTLIRQLRNQLEDAESARSLAMKARQTAEAELTEVQAMFEESHRARNDAEERANTAHRDRAELQAQIEENEEELGELMKKYSATVKQLNAEQINVSESEFKLTELEAERNNLKEQVAELQHRLDNVESLGDPTMAVMSKRLEMRTKELESRLELEQATRARLEVQVSRHKESLEKLQNEVTQSKIREMQGQEVLKKSQKSLRDMREEFHSLSSREQESLTRRKDLEKKMEVMESEGTALKNDLRLALQRIADLQQAMEEEGEEELSESDESISSVGSISDLEDRLRPVHVKRNSQQSLNGIGVAPSTTRTIVCEKDDNSPRITVTSPSSPHIHKLALAAKAIPDPKPDTKTAAPKKLTTAAAAATPTTLSPKTGTTTAAASAAATTINGVDKP
ncbi:unconventional myosin-XVIIIa isoform X5 [Drosophila albomicans]|uniref:Unconventional myosin-XVIIIa isoform X5 n=2 Tax=Drosophila albomicans TaxID=7291 RepID=A0A6P8XTC2_DROAB|nr:unconventional myosin-XVIIIa isoform X5 [Drosophila albomicans]